MITAELSFVQDSDQLPISGGTQTPEAGVVIWATALFSDVVAGSHKIRLGCRPSCIR